MIFSRCYYLVSVFAWNEYNKSRSVLAKHYSGILLDFSRPRAQLKCTVLTSLCMQHVKVGRGLWQVPLHSTHLVWDRNLCFIAAISFDPLWIKCLYCLPPLMGGQAGHLIQSKSNKVLQGNKNYSPSKVVL